MTWVKICGITNLEDALLAVDAGADAVGFVFYEKSPRKVDVETAREIVAKLPEKIEKVGVFVDQSAETIAWTVKLTGLSTVQLHGLAAMESASTNPGGLKNGPRAVKTIPVVHLGEFANGIAVSLSEEVKQKAFAIMFDSGSTEKPGGSGQTFDWEEYGELIRSVSSYLPVIIAGGLNSGNVGRASEIFRPFGVDVSSGVEARPGKKDPEKVRAFVQAVREADRNEG
jgi:phosphoribosylanthranilate isomerase